MTVSAHSDPAPRRRPLPSPRWLLGTAGLFTALAAIIMAWPVNRNGGLELQVGQSAPQEILAPRALSYVSQVLTAQTRAAAAANVPPVYDPPSLNIARAQVQRLREILDFINLTRADPFARPPQKVADVRAIRALDLSPEAATQFINFNDTQWTTVQNQALATLDALMRGAVRPEQVLDVQRAIPARLSVNLSDAQVQAVTDLVAPLIVPNSFYNEEATLAAQAAAREAVAPVYKQVVRGQAVVARGQVITEEDLETLRALGLIQTEFDWRQPLSGALAAALAGLWLSAYLYRFHRHLLTQRRWPLLVGALVNLFLLAAQLMVPERVLLPYILPTAALALVFTVVGGPGLGLNIAVTLGALLGFLSNNNLELAVYGGLGGVVAAVALNRAERVADFFWAGLACSLVSVAVIVVFWLGGSERDAFGLFQLSAAGLMNGALATSLALGFCYVLGGPLNLITSLQLVELARPDQPLLQFVLRTAPGTYQHSLQVANLAEQAGEQIGANVMLIRVGALYHDVGKALNPQYFVENQHSGMNPHEALPPAESARVIIAHVTEGLKLAAKHRLPPAIRDFIAEHHGTLMTYYQYKRAVQAAGDDPSRVPSADFRYPGPRPRSRETALVMLADGCEAKTRADRPQSEAQIAAIVRAVIQDRVNNHQLDDTDLTLSDLAIIEQSFITTLRGVFHPRLAYPELPPTPPQP